MSRHPSIKKAVARVLALAVLCTLAGCGIPTAPTRIPETPPAATPAVSAPVPTPSEAPSDTPPGDAAYAVGDPDPLPWDALPTPLAEMDFDSYPIVDGSTATRPLSQALAYHMTGITDMYELDLLASHTVTDTAYTNLLYGWADLLLVYAPADATVREIADAGVELESTPIGRDALVFLLNQDNPVPGLTTRQIRDIYSGGVTNWSEVGGTGAPIMAFQRPELSGSQTLMRKLVMDGRAMTDAPSEYRPIEMGDLIKVVSNYRNEANAIGYTVFYYASRMYMEPGVKIIPVDGVMPSAETLADASYPYLNDFYAVIRKDTPADAPARKMYDIMRGDLGRRMVEAMGYAAPMEP